MAAAAVGLATHLYMVPVVAAHVGALLAQGRLDECWRKRLLWTVGLAGCAYAGMADVMLNATAAHGRVFRADMPWQVATMATGGGWASLVIAPLVVVGVWVVLRAAGGPGGRPSPWPSSSRRLGRAPVRRPGGPFLRLAGARRCLPGGRGREPHPRRSPGRGRIGRPRGPGGSAVAPGYTADPTGYRAAAALLRAVDAAGERGCVVGSTGVQPMLAYLDESRDFAAVTDPSGLDGCDVVVVATWWPTSAEWFSQDRRVIDAAEARFAYRLVIGPGDPALVLSNSPLP